MSLISVNPSPKMMVHLHTSTGMDSKFWCTVGFLWWHSQGREPWLLHLVYMHANIFATWVI